jgi:hypothetical protein
MNVIEQLVQITPPLVQQRWRTDSCIAATRIGVLALRELGVPARPVPVQWIVGNKVFAKLVHERGWPPTADVTRAWWDEARAWALGVGVHEATPVREGRWNGHLVILAGRTLIDLSAMQASRPQRDIVIDAPIVTEVPRGWERGGVDARVSGPTWTGTYEAAPRNNSYLTAPDWTRLERHRPIVRQIVTAIARKAA